MKDEELNRIIHQELTSVLANERTYAAWIRTGLTSFAAGLGVEKFIHGVIPDITVRIISMAFFLCSALFFFLAAWRYQHVGSRMKTTNIAGASEIFLFLISVLLLIVVFLTALGVWLV